MTYNVHILKTKTRTLVEEEPNDNGAEHYEYFECDRIPVRYHDGIINLRSNSFFRRAVPNDAYVKGMVYHIDAGTNRHILVVISRIFSVRCRALWVFWEDFFFLQNREMTEEMFPHKVLVEAKGRTEREFLVSAIATALHNLAQSLKP